MDYLLCILGSVYEPLTIGAQKNARPAGGVCSGVGISRDGFRIRKTWISAVAMDYTGERSRKPSNAVVPAQLRCTE